MSKNVEFSIALTEAQFSFLEDFEKRCGNSVDLGISKASILRCLLKLFEEVEVDLRIVRTEDEILHRTLTALKSIYI